MNTYLVPFDDNSEIDIFKVTALSWEECLQKIMDKYINKFECGLFIGIIKLEFD